MGKPGGAARWWRGAALYQVYVRSWIDTNGDGYGDIPGVTARLDYLSWLGVDGIWLSPTMPSQDDEGRDHARTPMRWDGTPSAGFSAPGVRPWLPRGPMDTNVAAQRDEQDSVLRLCRDLIALRSAEHSGRIAGYRQLPAPEDVWAFQAGDLSVTVNFSARPVDVGPPAGPVVASSSPGALHGTALAPWAGVITRPAR